VLVVGVGWSNNSQGSDLADVTWTSAGSTFFQFSDCRYYEMGPQVLRPDGTVFVFGGTTTGVAHTAIFNSSNGSWSPAPDLPSVCRSDGTSPCTAADAPAALLPNGNILFAAAPSDWPDPTGVFNPPPGT